MICIFTASIHLSGSFWTGFISDDYELMKKAEHTSFLDPLETHHQSFFILSLFKLASKGHLSPLVWHFLALLAHFANVIIVFFIARRGFDFSHNFALILSLLFALNPAGYEAIAWPSVVGYVYVAIPLLLSLLLVLNTDRARVKLHGFIVAVLQFVAFLIWDWGILLMPILCVCIVLFILPTRRLSIRKSIEFIAPTIFCWLFVMTFKFLTGYSVGYHILPPEPITAIKYFLGSPLLGLFPYQSLGFYQSTAGIMLVILLLLLLFFFSIRYIFVRFLVALFFLCQLPYVFFAAPQSRYFYFSILFMYASILFVISKIPKRSIQMALLTAFITINAIWAYDRSRLWRGAYEQAQEVKRQIEIIPLGMNEKLLIVNLPDHYGPEDMIWPPFMWRHGISVFDRTFELVNTTGCPYTYERSGIPFMDRSSIERSFKGMTIFEVVYEKTGDWKRFKVLPFDMNRKDKRSN
jgi:hypothetical protein